MVKRLLALLFMAALAFSLSVPGFAQEAPKDKMGAAKEKPAKEARWEGIIVRSDKDKMILTVRPRGGTEERTVQYDSSTKWQSQEHHSKKVNMIDASQVSDNDRVICVGSWDKKGVLHATLISKRLTN